jgi:hypothetical protein
MGLALLEVAAAQAGLGDRAAARDTLRRALAHLHATYGPDADTTRRAEGLRAGLGAGPPATAAR